MIEIARSEGLDGLTERPGFELHYGQAKAVLAHALPDEAWPGMWRLHWPDGRVSDMTNLTRCKDAGRAIAGGRHGSTGYHWKFAALEGPGNVTGRPAHAFFPAGPVLHPPANTRPAVSDAGVSPAVTGRDVAHA